MLENQSEVAQVLKQIAMEYEAAQRGLTGLAETARHDFITARMEQMHQGYQKLAQHVGGQEAIRLVAEHLNQQEQ